MHVCVYKVCSSPKPKGKDMIDCVLLALNSNARRQRHKPHPVTLVSIRLGFRSTRCNFFNDYVIR